MMGSGVLCLPAWEAALSPDDPQRAFILEGVRNGFRVISRPYTGRPASQENYRSATGRDTRQAVEDQIVQEIENGRYLVVDSPPMLISPWGRSPRGVDLYA